MKFCYIDESGTGDEPFAVMVGVLVDAYRMKPTKEEWDLLLSRLSKITQREIKEFHTRDFYRGRSFWRSMDGEERSQVIDTIFDWYEKRSHHIVYSVIDKNLFESHSKPHNFYTDIGSLWRVLSFHIALSIQKHHQKIKNNKGNTLMIFDAHEKDQRVYTELLLTPPEWSDTYYSKGKKQKRLDQIIDVPHFVNSSHVGMIQLADCISYILSIC